MSCKVKKIYKGKCMRAGDNTQRTSSMGQVEDPELNAGITCPQKYTRQHLFKYYRAQCKHLQSSHCHIFFLGNRGFARLVEAFYFTN